MIHRRTTIGLVLIVLLSAAANAQRVTEWQARSGSWHEPKNWSAGVPNEKLPAVVANGSVAANSGIVARQVPVAAGLTVGDSTQLKAAEGVVEIDGTDLSVFGDIVVGQSVETPSIGALSVSGALSRDVADLNVTGAITTGLVAGGKSTATGKLTVADTIFVNKGATNADLIIGLNQAAGNAVGAVEVGGTVGDGVGVNDVYVGWNNKNQGGSAEGRLTATQLQSDGQRSVLAVGFNTGPGAANGYVEINGGISGFTQAIVGVANGTGSAAGTVQVRNGEFQVDALTIGNLQQVAGDRLRSVGEVILDNASFEGRSVSIGPGSGLHASTLIQSDVFNSGNVHVLDTPSTRKGQPLTVRGNYQQTRVGTTTLDIEGERIGTEYESIIVSGLAELDGQLEVRFSERFQPKLGQTFELVRAGKMSGLPTLSMRNPPADDLAFQLDQRFEDSALLVGEFVRPTLSTFSSSGQTSVRWGDANAWSGQVPTSANQVVLSNTIQKPQTIQVDENANVQSISLSGDTASLTLAVERDTLFSATHSVAIDSRATLQLNDAAIAAARVNIDRGGALAGQGTVEGDIRNGGLLQIGLSDRPSQFVIDGDYVQDQTGVLDVDVAGLLDGQFDALVVNGAATIGGLLNINLDEDFRPTSDFEIPIIDAANGISGQFRLLDPKGLGNFEFGLTSGPGDTVLLKSSMVDLGDFGDMNRDDRVDMCDIPAFGLALTDQIAYENEHDGWSPFTRGNVNGDEDFDIDDREMFLAMVQNVPCAEAAAVPEPNAWPTALGAWMITLGWRRQRRDARS